MTIGNKHGCDHKQELFDGRSLRHESLSLKRTDTVDDHDHDQQLPDGQVAVDPEQVHSAGFQ